MMIPPSAVSYFTPQPALAWGSQSWGYGASFPAPSQGVSWASRVRAREPELRAALALLEQTVNLPQDEAYLQSLGVNIVFRSGRDALATLVQRGVDVAFGDTGDPSAHAVWVSEQNRMLINQNYRGNMTLPVLYAIAASIYHEAGHAAHQGDSHSSIQEEIDCLALNTMAYRAHMARDPQYAYATSQGPHKALFDNGVALYPQLFFDPDPSKRRLINRVIEKYGMLPPDSPDHAVPMVNNGVALAHQIMAEIQRRRAWGA